MTAATLTRYSPPGFLPDFDAIPGQLDQWSHAIARWFEASIVAQSDRLHGQKCQYYEQLGSQPGGPYFRQEIVWNAFPGTLLRRWGHAFALVTADHLLPFDQRMDSPAQLRDGQWRDLHYRPQDEYCEWRVERDPAGRIIRVTFTSEPPEFWMALHGDSLDADDGDRSLPFTGDADLLRDLYRQYVNPAVELDDLICHTDIHLGAGPPVLRKGEYNPYNRWNTTHGLMHLCHPSNTLTAEIRLGADASVLWCFDDFDRRVVADADTLIARANLGGNNRCSDPTIAASVNQLAALGYGITLADPVGLYMDHLDMTGWTIGERDEPVDPSWFTVLRGQPRMIERAVFEVPSQEGTVSDVKINGEPIQFGGQLAERMTVKLVGVAALGANHKNTPTPFRKLAFVYPTNPSLVFTAQPDADDLPTGGVPVFLYPEAISAARAAVSSDSPDLFVRAADAQTPDTHTRRRPIWSRSA